MNELVIRHMLGENANLTCTSSYLQSKKTGPWNGHSSVIFPSLKPDGISKDGTNIICTS